MADTKFDLSRLASVLAMAHQHAAIGDGKPSLNRLPIPLRYHTLDHHTTFKCNHIFEFFHHFFFVNSS